MNASIVIRARNEAQHIGKVLDAIASQKTDGEVETILIDTASTDGTPDIARRHNARVISIAPEQFSWGYALNLGAYHARHAHIVNLSAHAVPADPHWLTYLLAPFADARVAGVFGRQLAIDHADPFEAVELDLWFPDWPEPRISGSFSNANGALRKDIWQRIPFDEKIMIAEDSVWAGAVSKLGYHTVYQPQSNVYHNHDIDVENRESTSSIFLRWYWRSYTMPAFMPTYRGADMRQVLRSLRTYCRSDFAHLKKNGYLRHIPKIPLYEYIRQYAAWRGARDYERGWQPQAPTWRERYFTPKPPLLIRLIGALL